MDFSTLFRTKENLNLDKSTIAILTYIAIYGQFIAVNIVFYYLKLDFPIEESYVIIFFGLITNLFLQFKVRVNQLKDTYASFFLLYDLVQLSILLYLTGGILNPFSFLLIIPAIVSSTFLSMGTTIILSSITSLMLFILTYFYLPLPGMDLSSFNVPSFYKLGILTSILIGLAFLSYFGIRFSGETKKRSEALNKLQEVIAKEYELESLGGQAAAAAHSLGTPLATISVVAKELKKEIGDDKEISKDIDLLISQTKRCSEILKKISK
jgi:two-component system sensor histidine kinase RegB